MIFSLIDHLPLTQFVFSIILLSSCLFCTSVAPLHPFGTPVRHEDKNDHGFQKKNSAPGHTAHPCKKTGCRGDDREMKTGWGFGRRVGPVQQPMAGLRLWPRALLALQACPNEQWQGHCKLLLTSSSYPSGGGGGLDCGWSKYAHGNPVGLSPMGGGGSASRDGCWNTFQETGAGK